MAIHSSGGAAVLAKGDISLQVKECTKLSITTIARVCVTCTKRVSIHYIRNLLIWTKEGLEKFHDLNLENP